MRYSKAPLQLASDQVGELIILRVLYALIKINKIKRDLTLHPFMFYKLFASYSF